MQNSTMMKKRMRFHSIMLITGGTPFMSPTMAYSGDSVHEVADASRRLDGGKHRILAVSENICTLESAEGVTKSAARSVRLLEKPANIRSAVVSHDARVIVMLFRKVRMGSIRLLVANCSGCPRTNVVSPLRENFSVPWKVIVSTSRASERNTKRKGSSSFLNSSNVHVVPFMGGGKQCREARTIRRTEGRSDSHVSSVKAK